MKLKLIRAYFGLSSAIAPKRTGARSFGLFQKVRIKNIREREELFYSKTRKFNVAYEKEIIDGFEMGSPEGKLVILVHGWESNAGSMSQLANKLAELDYRVVAFNLPGHAFYKASTTNLLECKLAMKTVLNFLQPTESFSVIAHSFGSAVVANGLSNTNYKVDRLVFLTNPNKVEDIFIEFKETIGLSKKAYSSLIKSTTQLLGAPISTLDVDTNLKQINFEKLLMIHDVNDQVLPYSNSQKIHSELDNSQLITLEKVGHYKMLWTDEVVDKATAFVQGKEVS